MEYKDKLKWILPVLSGMILALGFPPFSIPLLSFFALLPLFFFLNRPNISPKKSFFGGLLAGFIFFGWVTSWLFDVIFAAITESGGDFLKSLLLGLIWFVTSLFLALFLGFFNVAYLHFRRNGVKDILLVPSLWVIFEYLRAFGLGLFLAGEGYLLGAHWTLGNLAYSLAQNGTFRFLSSAGGIYLVSFLIVLINFILFLLLRSLMKERVLIVSRRFLITLAILFLLVSSYFLVLPQGVQEDESLNVAILQTEFTSSFSPAAQITEEKSKIQNQLLKMVRDHYPETDVVVFPEGSDFLRKNKIEPDYFEDKDVLIVDSWKEGEEKEKFVGTFYSIQKGFLGEYQKILLIPYSDYFPYFFDTIVKNLNWEKLEEFRRFKDRERGEDLVIFPVPGIGNAGLLFCSEAVSPDLHRELSERGSQIFFNSGSLAFSGGSESLDYQTLAMLQFRAAENGKYLVRSTNYGRSYIINSKGDVISISSDAGNQILPGEAGLVSGTTLYSELGDWILLVAIFILVPFILSRFRK